MPNRFDKLNVIQIKIEQLGFKEDAWLREQGWERDCSFPDSCWRWCKLIDGKLICTDKKSAISMEQNMWTEEDIDNSDDPEVREYIDEM